MKKIIFLLMLITAGSAFSATHTISSLPYTSFSHSSDSWDTLRLSGNLVAQANGISLSDVSNLVIDLGDDTIFFGADGGSNHSGIALTYCNNVIIQGGAVIHIPGSGAVVDGAQYNYCIDVARVHDILVDEVDMIIDGGMGHCFYGHAGGDPWNYNVEVRGGYMVSRQDWYESRCAIDQSVIMCDVGAGGQGFGDYNYYVHHVTVDSAAHTGINGYGKCWFDSNYVMVDAHNDKYSYPSGGVCYSADNPYAIGLSPEDGLDCRIVGNVIRSGSRYEGGRGIYIDNARASSASPVEVAYNDVVVNNGRSDYYTNDGEVFAMRARYTFENVKIHNNHFEIIVDDDQSTTAIGASGIAAYITPDAGSHDVEIYNNTAKVTVGPGGLSEGGDASYNYAMAVAAEEDAGANNFKSYNNRLISPVKPLSFCVGYTSTPCNNWLSVNDTLEWTTPHIEDRYQQSGVVSVGYYAESAYGNKMCDPVFIGGSSDDVVNGSNTEGVTRSIFWQKTVRVTVVGNNGQRVSGASVTVTNNYSRSVLSGTTINGLLEGVVNYDFDLWTGSSSSHVDSSYNNFTVRVQKDADVTTRSFIIDDVFSFPVCTLSATAGEIDSTGPSAVNDLACQTGDGNGEIDLGWTAVGDDGMNGTATYYVIKYSPDPITEGNWPAVTTSMVNPPLPQASGTYQTATLSGLVPGASYYIAMKVYDDAANPSPLSNSVNCEAGVSIVTSDYKAPAAVQDLQCEIIGDFSELELSWTATGDDGYSGTATIYDIRYSSDLNALLNWTGTTQLINIPVPKSSGTIETITVNGFNDGNTYYFALKTADEVGNWSFLSNIVTNGICSGGCIGIRGNIDNDDEDVIDIVDLIYMVNFFFANGVAPVCASEADVNGDGTIDILDLVYFSTYYFGAGKEPATCP